MQSHAKAFHRTHAPSQSWRTAINKQIYQMACSNQSNSSWNMNQHSQSPLNQISSETVHSPLLWEASAFFRLQTLRSRLGSDNMMVLCEDDVIEISCIPLHNVVPSLKNMFSDVWPFLYFCSRIILDSFIIPPQIKY